VDPHPLTPPLGKPTCPTPATATLGAQWTCPDCGRVFLALVDERDEGRPTFGWVLVDDST